MTGSFPATQETLPEQESLSSEQLSRNRNFCLCKVGSGNRKVKMGQNDIAKMRPHNIRLNHAKSWSVRREPPAKGGTRYSGDPFDSWGQMIEQGSHEISFRSGRFFIGFPQPQFHWGPARSSSAMLRYLASAFRVVDRVRQAPVHRNSSTQQFHTALAGAWPSIDRHFPTLLSRWLAIAFLSM